MSVVISSDFILSPGVDGLDSDSPIIGYETAVTAATVAATTEDPDHPASNLGNPATHLYWRAGAGSPSTEEYLTVTPDVARNFDYLAVAGHNLGSSQAIVSVEGALDGPGSPEDWTEVVGERLLPDDKPVIFRFNKDVYHGLRLRIQESMASTPETPRVAVLYAGELLYLQRRIYVGHTPLPYGRRLTTANPRSVSGNFLGRVVLGRSRVTTVEMRNLTPDWYRSYFEPFVLAAEESPFFFAWRPGTYPDECGFAWTTDDVQPSNQLANGMMQVSMSLEGVA